MNYRKFLCVFFEYSSLTESKKKKILKCESVFWSTNYFLFFSLLMIHRHPLPFPVYSLGITGYFVSPNSTRILGQIGQVDQFCFPTYSVLEFTLFLAHSVHLVPSMKFQSIWAVSVAIFPIPGPTYHDDSFHRWAFPLDFSFTWKPNYLSMIFTPAYFIPDNLPRQKLYAYLM